MAVSKAFWMEEGGKGGLAGWRCQRPVSGPKHWVNAQSRTGWLGKLSYSFGVLYVFLNRMFKVCRVIENAAGSSPVVGFKLACVCVHMCVCVCSHHMPTGLMYLKEM